jgi:hypothetical protein
VKALGTTLGEEFVPGSNLKGAVEGANWCFLLPSLEIGRVVSVGAPSPSALATLSRLSNEIIVWAPSRDLRRLRDMIGRGGSNKISLLARDGGPIPLPDRSADVMLLARRGLASSLSHDRTARDELERLLKPGGVAYAEFRASLYRLAATRAVERAFELLGPPQVMWLAPAFGEMRAAASRADAPSIAYLERSFLTRRLLRLHLVRRPGRVLGRQVLTNRVFGRCGALASRPEVDLAAGPPDYLRSVAAQAGVRIDPGRWGFAAPGDYRTQKLLFFIFAGAKETPDSVVKMTRDPQLNPRLEREWHALTVLQERGIGDEGTVPRPLFAGRHADLAIVGQTAVEGVPFRRQMRAAADCPYASAVVDWLLELGTITAHTQPTDSPGIAARLEALLARFTELYRVDPVHGEFLADQVAAIARSETGLPLVFQHGDPGPWNLLVTRDGRPAFLDWEAADPEGLPLWDIFHFLRSFGLAISRRAGRSDPIRSFTEQVLADSDLNRLIVQATTRFCAATPLRPELVEPLFYLCWMHRALKEVPRLHPARLDTGRYVNVLRRAINQRDAPGLRRLFSLSAAAG